MIAITWPSATTSSILTSSDLSFPAAGEATGISIFIASTNAMSSPSPTLLPCSTGSTQTRPATSVTILISGIPFSERDRLADNCPCERLACCGGRLPEVACSASGILFRTAELNGGHFDGTTLGTAQQAGHARQRSCRRGRCHSGGVARLRCVALLRGP